MRHQCDYRRYSIAVCVEADSNSIANGFVATIQISHAETAAPMFAPLRLGDTGGKKFASSEEALTAGCSAAQRMIDDLASALPESALLTL